MSRKEKREQKIMSLSPDVSYSELESFLVSKGFVLSQKRGSHRVFRNEDERLTITCPHGNSKFIAVYQLKQVRDSIERIEARKDE